MVPCDLDASPVDRFGFPSDAHLVVDETLRRRIGRWSTSCRSLDRDPSHSDGSSGGVTRPLTGSPAKLFGLEGCRLRIDPPCGRHTERKTLSRHQVPRGAVGRPRIAWPMRSRGRGRRHGRRGGRRRRMRTPRDQEHEESGHASWKGDHHGCGGWVGVRRKQDSPSPLCRDSNASATPIVRSSASRATPQTAALCAKDRTWSLGRATPASANRRRAPARDCRAHAHGRRSRDRRAPG
jgi:hypothetical protein